jgi:hypothetical protein
MMMFTIGARSEFTRRAMATAVMSWRALVFRPSTAVVMHISGYDDDPRELWQIPEVCDFVRRFCEKTRAHEHPAIEPMSRSLLLACGADPDRHFNVTMITRDEALERTGEFFKSKIKSESDD